MNEFVDRRIESWITSLDRDETARLAAGLYTAVIIACPEIVWHLTEGGPIADISQETYQKFPIQSIYRWWANFCRWPKMLEGLEEAFNSSGTFSDRLPQTYALGSGLAMTGPFVQATHPPGLAGDIAMYTTTELGCNILNCKNLPICFTSRGRGSEHPWVVLMCETLELVRQHARRWVPPDGVRTNGIKAVLRAFIHDRTEFFWKPREVCRFSQKGVQNSWFGQIAEMARSKPIPRGWIDHSDILWDRILVGTAGYRNSRFSCGVSTVRTAEWAEAVAKHIMTHHLPKGSPTAPDDGWVAKVDKVILDDLHQLTDEENGATR